MAKGCLPQLVDAKGKKRFIRLSRRFEDSKVRGYVVDVGPKFFLLALVSDRIRFDGFECFRISDVLDVTQDPYAAFAESALKKRGQRKPTKPRVSLASIETILLSAARAFPLVTIHREQVEPHVCWIGRVLDVNRGHVSLLEIGPDATWEDKPDEYPLGQITRVNFGGDYEDALHLVGGDPFVG
ncbi:MAG: hypothetical protein ACLPHP_19070 [Candidatus Sulfotelmatobacter sp.]